MEREQLKDDLIELIKYGFWGGITTIINLVLFWGMVKVGMYYIVANIASYIIAVIVNYILNKKYVFVAVEQSQKSRNLELIKFIGVRVMSLLIDTVLFYCLIEYFHVNVYIGRIGLSFIIIIMTFLVNKMCVFK